MLNPALDMNSELCVQKCILPWYKDIEIVAFTIDNVLTKEECDAWIADSEKEGYEEALINTSTQVYDPTYRRSKRCIIDSNEKANFLWEKVQKSDQNFL